MAASVRFYPLESVDSSLLRFAVIVARQDGKWLFCRHRDRETWECPGGHIEAGESAAEAARRELYEETGTTEAEIEPVCVYSVSYGGAESFGLLCRADVVRRDSIPDGSEIVQTCLLDGMPERWTYPDIQPRLLERTGLFVLSVREHPAYAARAVRYLQSKWASEASAPVYEDCLIHMLDAPTPLPQWYLLLDGCLPVGCAGLIPNDFISRMDLMPWLCALFVEESHRGHGYGERLIRRVRQDAALAGFDRLYLCTDLTGYYEKYGFSYLAQGYHPWGEASRVYEGALS